MLSALRIGGAIEPWTALGLTAEDGSTIRVGAVALRFEPTAPAGVAALGLDLDLDLDPDSDRALSSRTDGIVVFAEPVGRRAAPAEHPSRALLVDHVVVMTSSLERTCGAVEAELGAPLKRIRDVGGGVRQGFHRLGEVILEVVESPQHGGPTAELWGMVINVEDLAALAEHLGSDLLTAPKAAVQPGRLISNVRREAGLPCPVASMTP